MHIAHPPLGCNGSAWKRGVRIGDILEHVYDNNDDNDSNNSNNNNNDGNNDNYSIFQQLHSSHYHHHVKVALVFNI